MTDGSTIDTLTVDRLTPNTGEPDRERSIQSSMMREMSRALATTYCGTLTTRRVYLYLPFTYDDFNLLVVRFPTLAGIGLYMCKDDSNDAVMMMVSSLRMRFPNLERVLVWRDILEHPHEWTLS